MFKRKIDDILKEIPNAFGIADNIIILGHCKDGIGHDDTLRRVIKYAEKKTYS